MVGFDVVTGRKPVVDDSGHESGHESGYDAAYDSDGASYVDAATVALRYAAVELGQAPPDASSTGSLTGRPVAPVSPRALRDTMGSLVTGVCVITTVSDGEDVAMTANSVTSVSLDPPLILVCVAHTARFHEAIVGSTYWGVSILEAEASGISSHFATSSRSRERPFENLRHHRGEVTGVALVDPSCAFLECRTEAVHEAGDHSIVVGRVLSVEQDAESVHPLVFHRGVYSWLRR